MGSNTEQTGKLDHGRSARIDRALKKYVDAGKIAGVLGMVAHRGETVYSQCYGMQNIEAKRPMADDTIFRIYSMSKPITSVAVLMLYEEGCFHLTDPISRFIPAFRDMYVLKRSTSEDMELSKAQTEITIWHLLTHTAGLSYGFDAKDPLDKLYQDRLWAHIQQHPETTLAEVIGLLATLPLAHEPGTAWRYSMATDVLGYLVQVVSGRPFDVFLKERIFDPLGMTDTDFYAPPEKHERLAAVYGPGEDGKLRVVGDPVTGRFTQPTKCPMGGGGLVSTASDYMRFSQMLLNMGELEGCRLLGHKTIELMTQDHLGPELSLPDSPGHGFGLGVSVLTDLARTRTLGSVGSYGWGGAANTNFWIDPHEQLIGLLMLQFMPSGTYPIVPDFRVAVYQALL